MFQPAEVSADPLLDQHDCFEPCLSLKLFLFGLISEVFYLLLALLLQSLLSVLLSAFDLV